MALVRPMFRSVISRFGQLPWPARSPDLSVPEFFLWGYLKDRVFKKHMVTIQEIKQAIVDEVTAIDENLRRRVYENFKQCFQQCIDVNVGHLPDVVLKNLMIWNMNGIFACILRNFFFRCSHIELINILHVSIFCVPHFRNYTY